MAKGWNILNLLADRSRWKIVWASRTCNAAAHGMERKISIDILSLILCHNIKPVNGVSSIVGRFVLKSIPQGAATACYMALNPRVRGLSGKYFGDCNKAEASSLGQDLELAMKLWEFGESSTSLE